MTKGILSIFISLIFLAPADNKRKTLIINSVPFEMLNGNVKKIIEMAHGQFVGGNTKSYNVITDTAFFDKNGNPTEIHWGLPKGNYQVTKYETALGKKSKRVESRSSSRDGQTVYIYDVNGHIVRSFLKDKNGNEKYDTSYKYDADGKMIEQDYMLSPEFGQQVVFFKYDNQNRLIESNLFSKTKQLKDKTIFKYVSFDKNGNWAERIKKSTDSYSVSLDTITRKITYY